MSIQVLINGTQYSVDDDVAQAIALEHERQAVELNWLHMRLGELADGHKVLDAYISPSEDDWIPIANRIEKLVEEGVSSPTRTHMIQHLRQRAENAEAQLSNAHKALDAQGVIAEAGFGELSITGRVMRMAGMIAKAQEETMKWCMLVPSPSMLRELACFTPSMIKSSNDAFDLADRIEKAQLQETQSDFDEEGN